MLDPNPPSGIRDPLRLIVPIASGQGDGDEDAASRKACGQRTPQLRLLIVEDEFLLSTVLAADLRAAGYDVLGPYPTLAAALAAVQSETFDAAILDINLKGQLVYPVAEELVRRHIPFLFLSGYALVNMPERFRAYPRIAKPADGTMLLRAVQNMLRGRS